jgi:dTDP-4-amino-4,6-dideoxygalactose transaminase
MKVPLYDPRGDHLTSRDRIDLAIRDVLDNGVYILGPQVEAFEKEFAAYCGSRFAVGVASGSAAVELALRACGIDDRDEVITVPNTDMATTAAITRCGAKVVFVDVEPDSLVMNPREVESKITPRTKAILPVHVFGQPVEMDPVLEIAAAKNLHVIEDAALAVGAMYRDRKAGTMGDAGCFSMAPNKILGAIGNAGIIVTDRDDVAEELRSLRNYGKEAASREVPWSTLYRREGLNERLEEIQAAVLRVKLPALEKTLERRRHIARKYQEGFRSLNVVTPHPADHVRHAYRAYTILVDERDGLARFLAERDIETAVYYAPPLHVQAPYRHLPYEKGDFPVVEEIAERMLSLPIHPTLSNEQIDYVIETVAAAVST